MNKKKAENLIARLLMQPEKFDKSGAAYALLQEYFLGYPAETLLPLLGHSNYFVQKSAVWVTSELGRDGWPLLSGVLPMLDSDDRYLAYHAIEIVAACGVGEFAGFFSKVPTMMENQDEVLRITAMRLIGNTGAIKMDEILRQSTRAIWDERHFKFLKRLVNTVPAEREGIVEEMLGSSVPLERKYGAILARWTLSELPGLIFIALKNDDEDVRLYAERVVVVHELNDDKTGLEKR